MDRFSKNIFRFGTLVDAHNFLFCGPVQTAKFEGLVIQALKEIGKDNVTEREISIILDHLKKEEPLRLTNDIKLAPEWIRIIMRRAQ